MAGRKARLLLLPPFRSVRAQLRHTAHDTKLRLISLTYVTTYCEALCLPVCFRDRIVSADDPSLHWHYPTSSLLRSIRLPSLSGVCLFSILFLFKHTYLAIGPEGSPTFINKLSLHAMLLDPGKSILPLPIDDLGPVVFDRTKYLDFSFMCISGLNHSPFGLRPIIFSVYA